MSADRQRARVEATARARVAHAASRAGARAGDDGHGCGCEHVHVCTACGRRFACCSPECLHLVDCLCPVTCDRMRYRPGFRGVLLHLDSPGGQVAGTSDLADAIRGRSRRSQS